MPNDVSLTRELLRDEFNDHWSYDALRSPDIYALESMIGVELIKPGNHLPMHISRSPRKAMRMRYKGAGLGRTETGIMYAFVRVDGPYFRDREAVSFNEDGFIGFCGWADDKNSKPFLKAFHAWMRLYLPNRCLSVVGGSIGTCDECFYGRSVRPGGIGCIRMIDRAIRDEGGMPCGPNDPNGFCAWFERDAQEACDA